MNFSFYQACRAKARENRWNSKNCKNSASDRFFFFCFEKPVESFGCIAEDRINLCSRLRLNQVEGANGANRLTLSPFEVSKSLSNIQQQQNKAQLFVGSGEIRSDQHFAKRNGFLFLDYMLIQTLL